jgi:hypothetical protein
MPFTIITGGSYTSTGASQVIPLPSSADMFETWNFTQIGGSGTVCIGGKWFGPKFGLGQSAYNDGIRYRIAGSNAVLEDKFSTATASNGFIYLTALPMVEAQATNAITAITAANPAVVSQTNTYSNGDILRLSNTPGMLQIAGMDFEISSVSGSGYTLLGLPATASNGFAAAATAGNTRRVGNTLLSPLAVNPEMMYVTNISNATQAVVSTSVDPSLYYSVGMEIRLSVPPSSFGMNQMNGLTGTILAVNAVAATGNIGAYNVTLNINSSAFNAFAWPASTASPTAPLFATFAPAGASTQYNPVTNTFTGYDFNLQPFRTANFTPCMIIGGGAASAGGANLDQINWVAYKFEA